MGLSLRWNIQQAIDSSARAQALYKVGLRDGESYTRAQILRAELTREIIADQQATAGREKL